MSPHNRLTLTFFDAVVEAEFTSRTYARTVQQGRAAIVVGISVYLLHGLFDPWWVSTDHRAHVWAIRLTALSVPVAVFALTFTRWFAPRAYAGFALVGMAAGLGLMGMFALMPIASVTICYASLLLVTFFTYNLVGTRFIYALTVDLILLVCFVVIFALWFDYPTRALVMHLFLIVSANLIGGAAGYLTEYQHRQLFLRERELDAQSLQLFNRSMHDTLTGLPNRALLHDRLNQAINHSARDGLQHAGLFIDLDGFKQCNDHYGHAIGDQILKTVADRLSGAVREADTVARLGGDEFFMLVYSVGSLKNAVAKADALLALIKSAMPEMPQGFALTASIGICPFPYAGANVEDVIRRADQAMYKAKEAGKNRHFVVNTE